MLVLPNSPPLGVAGFAVLPNKPPLAGCDVAVEPPNKPPLAMPPCVVVVDVFVPCPPNNPPPVVCVFPDGFPKRLPAGFC